MDEDLAEMAALRKASRFKQHQKSYGDRTEYKTQQKIQEMNREKQQEQRKQQQAEKAAAMDQASTAEDDAAEKAAEAEAEAMAAMGFVSSFGKKNRGRAAQGSNKAEFLEAQTRKRKVLEASKAATETAKESKKKTKLIEGSADSTTRTGGGDADEVDEEEQEEQEEEPQDMTGISEAADKYKLPITHEAQLTRNGHSKPVTALTVDVAGARVISGGLDHKLKFWDFGGMTQELASFREKEPEENHPVMSVSFNPSGSHFLCCTGSVRPKIFCRDGFETAQFIRGDMYLHDMKYTKGHTAYVTCGMWHPTDKERMLTASVDGTIRIWEADQPEQCINTIKLQPGMKKRLTVTACTWSPDGALIAAGGNDGSLRMWDHKKGSKYLRPQRQVLDAHAKGEEITGIAINRAKTLVASRSTDHTLKLWDVRKFKTPLMVWEDLENLHSQTSVMFDPTDRLILTGTSNKTKRSSGKLMVYDANTLDTVQGISVCDDSVIKLVWHPTLNQIFASCSDGTVRVLYSPKYSSKGMLMCVGKRAAKKDVSDFLQYQLVQNPQHLKYFDEEVTHKNIMNKIKKQDPKLTKLPQKPMEGILGHGGRTYGNTMNQYIARNIVAAKIRSKDADPRAEILKYAEKAAADPMFLGRAYGTTQPVAIFDEAKITNMHEAKAEAMIAKLSNERTATGLASNSNRGPLGDGRAVNGQF